jgi:hypothetical protein
MRKLLYVLILFWGISACGLEKEIEITLPDYDAQPVVECYLEPGQPFRLLLTQSAFFFDPFTLDNPLETFAQLLLSGAEVQIRYLDQTIVLPNRLILDPSSGKVYNYQSDNIVPSLLDTPFELYIELADGTTIESNTLILDKIPFDSIVVEKNIQNKARILTYFTDPPEQRNYYRRMLHFGSLDSLSQDFTTDDTFADDQLVFGTAFEYGPGDTLINTLVHMSKEYFDYYNSIVNSANLGGPFIQPGELSVNVKGTANALGIFTGLVYARDTLVIPD